jgi:hypothetical protein
MGRYSFLASVVGGFVATTQPVMAQSAGGALVVEPPTVEIGLTFTGATLAVRAEVPPGFEAAVRLMGHRERQDLKKLGKKAHVLWMKVGDISVEAVPVVYQVLTSAPLRGMGSPSALAQWNLGYDLLIPEPALDRDLREEFVKLKTHDGLFAVREGALAMTGRMDGALAAQGDAARQAHGTFRLPASVPAGDYVVDLIGFRNREATPLATTVVRFEHVGAARFLKRFANEHGLAYGIVASLIAIAAGLLTGLLLRPKSDESH